MEPPPGQRRPVVFKFTAPPVGENVAAPPRPFPGRVSANRHQRQYKARNFAQDHKPSRQPPRQVPASHYRPSSSKVLPVAFEEYWSEQDVADGLKNKTLFRDSVRINQKNFEEAFVDNPGGVADLLLNGVMARNRALNDDIVAYRVNEKRAWLVKVQDLMKGSPEISQLIIAPNAVNGSPSTSATISSTGDTAGAADKPDGCEALVDGVNRLDINCKIPPTDIKNMLYCDFCHKYPEVVAQYPDKLDEQLIATGKVVSIIKQGNCRKAVGKLRLLTEKKAKDALLCPTDHRMPRIRVPLSQCPPDLSNNPKAYDNALFAAEIQSWPSNCAFPTGSLIKQIGRSGSFEAEVEAILISNGINWSSEFDQSVLDCVGGFAEDWQPSEDERRDRRDFTGDCVFTIDPATARDLDDALHCNKLSDDLFEIGVHIADVSHFVSAGSALDEEAATRTTSTYLPHQVIPMLPRILCDQLCSLQPGVHRLTLSIVWTIDSTGSIHNTWMGKGIIRSAAKLSYEHAQLVIDDAEGQQESFPEIHGGFSFDQIRNSILNLFTVSQNLKRGRVENGALKIDKVKIGFVLDEETKLPCGFNQYDSIMSHSLVEEFMLLANITVARKIHEAFPDRAFLRKHPPPKRNLMAKLPQECEIYGFEVGDSSSAGLSKALDVLHRDLMSYDRGKYMFIVELLSKKMQLAKYFCTGAVENKEDSSFRHYALSVDLYTHFTSPIRRYPDIIVHRLLVASLKLGPPESRSPQELEDVAHVCNVNKYGAKRASEQGVELFFALFVRENGPIEMAASVVGVLDQAADFILHHTHMVVRLYYQNQPDLSVSFTKHESVPQLNEATLTRKQPKEDLPPSYLLKLFQVITLTVSVPKDSTKLSLSLP